MYSFEPPNRIQMDKYNNRYRIPSARLQSWDYSSNGAYFITICTKYRQNFFGHITDGQMHLNAVGQLAEKYWMEITEHFTFIELGNFVVMPNHVHVLLRPINEHELEDILHSIKSFTANQINKLMERSGEFWQRQSYDHIVRDFDQLTAFQEYIAANPVKAKLNKDQFLSHRAAWRPDE